MAMTGALGSYPMERESSGTAWQPDTTEHMGLHDHERRLDLDGARRPQPRLRSPIGAAWRRQGVRVRDADGHGAAAARQRHAAIQGDAQPRAADGAERLSAAPRQRRDGERPRPADRPPASARFVHGAVGVGVAGHRAQEQPVPLRRLARRAGVRAAGLHAPRGDHRIRPRRRSATTGSIPPTSASAWSRRAWCSTA